MLDTLDRYARGSGSGLQDWRPASGLHRWWRAIIALSIIGHLFFFATLVAVDWWFYHFVIIRRLIRPEQQVTVVALAPPKGDDTTLRAPPEYLESIDLRHLKLEAGSDDTRLLPHSPTPGSSTSAGLGQKGSTSGTGGNSKRPGRPDESTTTVAKSAQQPPGSRTIQAPEIAAAERTTPSALPVAPASQPPAPEERPRSSRQTGESGDNGGRSSRIGLSAARSQYVAAVRTKIWRTNQRIMPRDWIASILSGEVVSEFSLVLDRSGRIRAVRLVQSCGYATLDQKAREAISLASPFEGFPPELGDSFEFTVDVHYTPFH